MVRKIFQRQKPTILQYDIFISSTIVGINMTFTKFKKKNYNSTYMCLTAQQVIRNKTE